MSLATFVRRCLRDPKHFGRRLRWEAWQVVSEREIVIDSLHGRLVASTKDQIIGRALYLTRNFAIAEIDRAFDLLVREGLLRARGNGLLLDIGANIGTTCIYLVGSGRFRSAAAFEPERKNVSFLKKGIHQNALDDRVRVFPFGLSSESRSAALAKSDINFGDHRVGAGPAGERRDSQSIRLERLDSVIGTEGLPADDISLIWMDTQGHEGRVLAGAVGLRERKIPMVMEFWPSGLREAGESIEEFLEEIALRYRAYYVLQEVESTRREITALTELARRLKDAGDYVDLVLIP